MPRPIPNPTSLAPSSAVAARALMRLLGLGGTKAQSFDPIYSRIAAAVESYGSTEALWGGLSSGELDLADVDLFWREHLEGARTAALQEVERWEASGFRFVAAGSSLYPRQLDGVHDAPPLLFIEGSAEVLSLRGVAVVGTRRCTEGGAKRAFKAARALVEADYVVYSGLARGIDSAAHLGAMSARGLTVAVMGTPVDRRYPAENRVLAQQLLDSGGTLVSEFVPGERTKPWHFLRRNRTMSGLSAATLVVEASETSGAKSQAIAALQHGRPVFIPTSLISSHSWARDLVEHGHAGGRAIEVATPEEIVSALSGSEAIASRSSSF